MNKIKRGDDVLCADNVTRTVKRVEGDGTVKFFGSRVVSHIDILQSD